MSVEAWITLTVVLAVLLLLATTRRHPDIVLMSGVLALTLAPVPSDAGWRLGVIDVHGALAGLANEGVATIAVLYVVAAGLRDTGAFARLAKPILGQGGGEGRARRYVVARIMAPAALLSAFMNNTPLVAMMLPVIGDWSRRIRVAPSKLLLPLSFASILGGACTLLGTSSNLIVHGWLVARFGEKAGLSMFEITALGVPIALAGIAFVTFFGEHLLPRQRRSSGRFANPRRYTVEMVLEGDSPLVGSSVAEAGLRRLPGLYLAEINRAGHVIPAVLPDEHLQADDRLIFVGVVDSVADLRKFPGLRPATDHLFKLNEPSHERRLVEAVISDSSPLAGSTISEGQFRSRYNAVVIAVARGRLRVRQRIGAIRLQPGDTLLLEAGPHFVRRQRYNRDFYLVSQVDAPPPPRHERAPLALAALALMVASAASGILTLLQAAMLTASAMLLTGCCSVASARRALDGPVLLAIAAALGIGEAMRTSGLAAAAANVLFDFTGPNPILVLAMVLVLTTVLANLVTAKAGAVMMLPIAIAAAADLEIDFRPFAIAVMIAAATAVATPISYPTNMMVHGPGGYRFADYLRLGLPITLISWLFSMILIPILWPFTAS